MKYTPSQHDAIISIDQNLQIIACAGSGKTQVVSARIVEILKRKVKEGLTPANIVAFTFTEKAAGELKDRIHKLCLQELGTDQGLAEMFVGTIHAYCLRMLQSPPLYKFMKYSVLTEIQQRLFIDRYSSQSGLTTVPLLHSGEHLQRWKHSRLYQQFLEILGEAIINQERVPEAAWEAYDKYQDLRETHKFLDYTMMIAEAVTELKQNPIVREYVSSQLRYLVVDEYQDINPLQEYLISELAKLGANVCVVGDDDQTIYQWRGSDICNIKEFAARYQKVKRVYLNENWRSTEGIVRSARRIIETLDDRLDKAMESTDAQIFERGDILALSFHNPGEEGDWIADKIQWLYGSAYKEKSDTSPRGLTYSDFTILLRSVRLDARPILSSLEKNGVPFVVVGMNSLFETKEANCMRLVFYYLSGFKPNGATIYQAELRQVLEQSGLGVTPEQVEAGITFIEDRKTMIGQRRESHLYPQRVFIDLLAVLGVREEAIDIAAGKPGQGSIIFYNLGKFSQVISDYDQIHFHASPADFYSGFARYLAFVAPEYYPEGWQEKALIKPNAVQVMTVHQAKGMEWPVVFIPALKKNRFPMRKQGGLNVWHALPREAVANASRYEGSVDDERRLFYVALTRAEKFLFCSWAPIEDNLQQKKISPFLNELTGHDQFLTKEPERPLLKRLPAKERREEKVIPLTFSELKYYFLCPYLFKLRFLYGFNPPIDPALGYGKSLHDALAEIHAESIAGRIPTDEDVPMLVETHLYLPYASEQIRENFKREATLALERYIREHKDTLSNLEHVEKIIELKLADGIVVNGRIDLIRKTDTGEIVIVDFKSTSRAQDEDITAKQLHVYAAGYEQLSGRRADLIEVHNLDNGGGQREMVDNKLTADTLAVIHEAGINLRENRLNRHITWCKECDRCDMVGLCRERSIAKGL
jgi:DNA helicase-2/ATP-dependent DNA helicase PcrA